MTILTKHFHRHKHGAIPHPGAKTSMRIYQFMEICDLETSSITAFRG